MQKIPCENLIISKHTFVCVKHFEEEDITRNDILPEKKIAGYCVKNKLKKVF